MQIKVCIELENYSSVEQAALAGLSSLVPSSCSISILIALTAE